MDIKIYFIINNELCGECVICVGLSFSRNRIHIKQFVALQGMKQNNKHDGRKEKKREEKRTEKYTQSTLDV